MSTMAVVGLGFMGGSLAAAARAAGIADRIVAIEPNDASAEFAVDHGFIDERVSSVPADAVLVALCLPSDLVPEWVMRLEDHVGTVFDIGSVKGHVMRDLAKGRGSLPANFVPCHPIAGSEKSGPEAADPDLFRDRVVVVTPDENTAPAALEAVRGLWRRLGARTVQMQADDHDAALATTSHLPHLLAFAFMGQVGTGQLEFAGGGFRDFTRIAAANPELWWRIFQLNRDELLAAVDEFKLELDRIVTALREGDDVAALETIRAAALKRKDFDRS
jgi:prephenate dehydrogenase